MENFVNIGSVSLYERDDVGGYDYARLFRPTDYIGIDATINIRDNMNFGAAFDFIGDHLIVGATYEEPLSAGDPVWNNKDIGAVYVFDKTNGDLLQRIIPDNTPGSWTEGTLSGEYRRRHNFGYSIACGTDFIVIGAPGYTENIGSTEYENSGRVYIYTHNGSEYELSLTITPTNRITDNRFGDSVLVVGSSIVVANSPLVNTANPGVIRYITMNDTRTAATQDVAISNTHGNWQYSLAVDTERIAVGDFANDTVRIYTIVDGISRLDHTITEDKLNSFEFGYDLEFDEDKLLISCPNGYYKLGVVLRMQIVSNNYTLI